MTMTKLQQGAVDMGAAEIAGTGRAAEAEAYLEHIRQMEIVTDPELEFAVGVVVEIKGRREEVDAERAGFIADAQRIIERANAFFKPAINSLSECEAELRRKIVEYDLRLSSERDALIDWAGAAAASGDSRKATALIAEADTKVPAKVPGLSYRRSVKVAVEDSAAAIRWCVDQGRLELLKLDEAAVRAAAKAADRLGTEIPGVVVTRTSTAAITASKVRKV